MADAAAQIEVGGRRLRVTNLDKVMYPATGTTKGDVIGYYQAVAPWFVPHASWRPATRKRWVHGVEGPAFFTKNLDSGTPDWVPTVAMTHSSDTLRYPLVNDAATLVFLAQLAALEIHVPQWRFSPTLEPQHPDRLVLDLDPGEGAGLPECVEVALIVKEILDGVGMASVPVTSGSKGIHLYAGLDGHLTSADASEFARQLALALEAAHPDLVVADMKKSLRGGKVLLDWSQNNGSKTTVAPYSLRGRTHPFVAAPRTWDEIGPGLGQLTYAEVLDRLHTLGDPLAALLPPGAEAAVRGGAASGGSEVAGDGRSGGGGGGSDGGGDAGRTAASGTRDGDAPASETSGGQASGTSDRLATYRSKRDAARTPEPVPEAPPAASDGNTFAIQEHHARRLHHDFRLEHDGVLVSWAIPKLTPLTGTDNRLAVQTEDHPLEYGSFAGRIPRGEYGAGEVTIWDAGTYECEKWRDGREVIATLHGRPDGGLGGVPRRYALIHTGRPAERDWLIHLMEPRPDPTNRPEATGLRGVSSETAHAHRFTLADLPEPEPMLATPAHTRDLRDDGWHFEVKWDGYRAIATTAGGAVRLGSRRGNDFTAFYPELGELGDLLRGRAAVLDGEIVALGPDGRSHFELLANHGGGAAAAHYMAFDLLWLDGASLLERPYVDRRAALVELLGSGGRFVHVPDTFGTDRELALTASAELKLEGLVAKRADSPYTPGRRSGAWLKVKNVHHQAVVIVGWRPGEGGRTGTLGSLLMAVAGADGLRYAGRVGSGFTDRALANAAARLAPLSRADPPLEGVPRLDARGVHWVEPVLIGEVGYTNVTGAGHLRHPVWRGWRPDLTPADAIPEG